MNDMSVTSDLWWRSCREIYEAVAAAAEESESGRVITHSSLR